MSMKAVVFHDVGDIRLETVEDPKIKSPTDAIVKITASAICGTDLHMVRGTLGGMMPGTILGHEGVGVVEEVGKDLRNFRVGDRVVIASTIACGCCAYCRSGYYSQCDDANPGGQAAGTAFFGGPESSGAFHGLQAEYARVPFAHTTLVKLPDEVSDDQAILLSDMFPTGYFGADLAEIRDGDTVVVYGCGPVGLFTIASAYLCGAGRVFAVDCHADRLDMARELGAETINFSHESPPETILRLTGGIGVDRAIDAVGVDAERPKGGPALRALETTRTEFELQVDEVAPETNPDGALWQPGNAPSLALDWALESLAKAGTLAVIGVYPPQARLFRIGLAMNKNLTIQMGNCPHRKYLPQLIQLTSSGAIDPAAILSQRQPLTDAIEAYKSFDQRRAGWVKVELLPAALSR
jgi:threonine dehydrogenase-like Zn-dependent dehydrogenase